MTVAIVVALAALTVAPMTRADANDNETVLCTAIMWAGQHTDVGTVVVSTNGEMLFVSYVTHSGWTLGTVHVEIGADVGDIPQNKGGPIPGKFTYKAEASGTDHRVAIPCGKLPQGELVILAHAETYGPGSSTSCDLVLPTGPVSVCIDTNTIRSYLRHTLTGAGALDGVYEGWCVDVLGDMGVQCFDGVTLVSSLDPAADGVISAPENWDEINYLLNQVDAWLATGATFWDLQWAFWRLSDPYLTPRDYPSDDLLAQRILDDALTNGAGFVPGDGEYVAVAVVHPDVDVQETIIPVRVTCEQGGEETAWAGDIEFPGKNWALYFTCEGCR